MRLLVLSTEQTQRVTHLSSKDRLYYDTGSRHHWTEHYYFPIPKGEVTREWSIHHFLQPEESKGHIAIKVSIEYQEYFSTKWRKNK